MFLKDDITTFFNTQGYAHTSLLTASEVDDLLSLFKQTASFSGVENKAFFTSIWSENEAYRKAVDGGLKEILEPALGRQIKEFQSIFANFMVKNAGDNSQLQPHQDWSFVDERKFQSMTIWIPLCDVDKSNGALEVYPGSHQINNFIRARFQNCPFQDEMQDIRDNQMLSIAMKAGEALFVNSRTIHASPPNLSAHQRLAVSIVVAPKSANLLHFVLDKNNSSEAFELAITSDFFTQYSCFDYPEIEEENPKVSLIPRE